MVESLARQILKENGWGHCKNQIAYEDLVQQGALGAALATRRYKASMGSFSAFAYKAIRGQMEDCFRRKNLRWMQSCTASLPEPASSDDLEQQTDEALISRVLQEMVQGLPLRQQAVLRQHYYEGRSQKAIAESLGVKKSQASEIHQAALRSLRQLLQTDERRGQGLREVFGLLGQSL